MRSWELERSSQIIAASGSAEAIIRYLETPIATIQDQLDDAGQEVVQRLPLV